MFSDRPFRKLEDGSYDFERIEIYTKAKHKREIRPLRQNKIREYNKKDFAFEARRRFAEAVNQHSKRQKFDPRSYKDMGYDVTPMGTVHGFVKNRSGDAPLLIDRERTREEVERKLREIDQTALRPSAVTSERFPRPSISLSIGDLSGTGAVADQPHRSRARALYCLSPSNPAARRVSAQ